MDDPSVARFLELDEGGFDPEGVVDVVQGVVPLDRAHLVGPAWLFLGSIAVARISRRIQNELVVCSPLTWPVPGSISVHYIR